MATSIEMSLDDIIRTNKSKQHKKPTTNNNGKTPIKSSAIAVKRKPIGQTLHSRAAAPASLVVDARNKIIAKNRSKIVDARDKLAQITKQSGDVRQKLLRKQQQQQQLKRRSGPHGLISSSAAATAELQRLQRSRALPPQRRSAPAAYPGAAALLDDIEMLDDFVPATHLRRTVHNDNAYAPMPPLPQFAGSKRIVQRASPPQTLVAKSGWSHSGPDPFDCYEVPMQRPIDVSEPKNLQRQIRGDPSAVPTKGILRYSGNAASNVRPPSHGFTRSATYGSDLPVVNSAFLSNEMRSRLERAPDSSQSAGMFSNPYSTLPSAPVKSAAKLPAATATGLAGYRIVVSNLHSSVSQCDVRELFEDIGDLLEARLVRPGVAEVIFATLKDAEMAVDTYHNRQLDGQPMKCLLVNSRPMASRSTSSSIRSAQSNSFPNSTASGHKSAATSADKSPLEIDIEALHKVLFQNKSYKRN